MTLRDLMAAHPSAFYPQTWYMDETFLDTDVPPLAMFHTAVPYPTEPQHRMLPHAAQVVAQMLAAPAHAFWHSYCWCRDLDILGQRIYVGQNGRGIEIHRHLHLTRRWVALVW